jgi:predicted RNA-binding protein with RPS1 domain
MQFTSAVVSAFLFSVSGASAFARQAPSAFVSTRTGTTVNTRTVSSNPISVSHVAGCACAACTSPVSFHKRGCECGPCSTSALFSTETSDAEVPEEVEAMDGITSEEEAHNVERPARKSIAKKAPKGKPLTDFNVGDTVTAKVKSIASYGAFMDFGAQTDGLLHISQLSVGYIKDVSEILKPGQEVEVRITNISAEKNQVALSMLSESEEVESKEAAEQPKRDRPQRSGGNNSRRDDSGVLKGLADKGWDAAQFVEGTVVSTVDFGAFVRLDASQLNPDVQGEMDGLVHISALTAGRAASVTSIVNVDDKVQVRVKAIQGGKVSLTMVSAEDEAAQKASSGSLDQGTGAKDWKEQLEKIQSNMGSFKNTPLVVDLRK